MPVLARRIEAAGIPTVTVTMMPATAEQLLAPRIVGVEFPFGHPFGRPGDRAVQRIVLTPENGELKIELIGDLAGILTIAVKEGAPLRTQKSRPERAAVLSNLASQVEMVAGAGFEPTTFRL